VPLFVQVVDLTGVDVRGGQTKSTHLTVFPTVRSGLMRHDEENTVRNYHRSDGIFPAGCAHVAGAAVCGIFEKG
jgi:hypothetical protein